MSDNNNIPDVICDIHTDTIEFAEECIELIKASWDFPMRDEVEFKLLEIIKFMEVAHNMGQSMENRLIEYRNAIEKLGYTKED